MNLLPQDVVVLLKLRLLGSEKWTYEKVAYQLKLSSSMVHSAVRRCANAGLYLPEKRRPNHAALKEFLSYGFKYCFFPVMGSMTRGIPTAYASPLFDGILVQPDDTYSYVWSHPDGETVGVSIAPLYKYVPEVCLFDSALYNVLSALDAARIGRARERKLAIERLFEYVEKPW